MIEGRWLDQRRARGISDTDGNIIAEWQAFEAEALTWQNAMQVARRFNRTRQAVSEWCRMGRFERTGVVGAIKIDGAWRINPVVLEGFVPPVEGGGPKPRRGKVK